MSIYMAPSKFARVVSIEETQKRLGHLIMLQRLALKLSQDELGARSGLTQTQISRFEKKGKMTYDIFMRACRGLELCAWATLKVAEDPRAFAEACSLESRFG